ncbi:hypothetical protein, partial [Nostoc sp.]|uniref:hypothetical protein n=1 Tax=Nostoc sp. TaxID=1180 RepID=UPI002FF42341
AQVFLCAWFDLNCREVERSPARYLCQLRKSCYLGKTKLQRAVPSEKVLLLLITLQTQNDIMYLK